MSIIGTRPPLISETNLYELHHRARLAIKPGITGMWQVSGRSDITDFEEVVRLDKEYITNWNIAFLFSLTIEFLQLFLRLGTFQLSDLCYNTFGGAIGGVSYIYSILWRFGLIRVPEAIEKKMGKQSVSLCCEKEKQPYGVK